MKERDLDWFDLALSTTHKWGLLIVSVSALVIVAIAMIYEKVTGILPCQLCWLQRWIFIVLAGMCLFAFMMIRSKWVRIVTRVILTMVSLTGIAIASRHLYIKMNPEMVSCGMDVETLLAVMPLQDAIRQMLIGSSDCAIAADLLGIPLPTWSIMGYITIFVMAIYSLSGRKRVC